MALFLVQSNPRWQPAAILFSFINFDYSQILLNSQLIWIGISVCQFLTIYALCDEWIQTVVYGPITRTNIRPIPALRAGHRSYRSASQHACLLQ